jgi:hypothetical protein
MEIPSVWSERLAAWRASGLSAEKFCADKELSVHSLRSWRSKQLEAERQTASGKKTIALARVQVAGPLSRGTRGSPSTTGVAIEVGALRVTLDRGFDRSTLAAVLGVISLRSEPSR